MAIEFAASAGANAVGNLATEYASPYLSYFFRFGEIVDDFNDQREKLESKKVHVDKDVGEAKRQNFEIIIDEDVQKWLTSADKELREAQTLKEEIERHKCFNWCPNWGWRYCLSKKVAKKTTCISKLLGTSNFPRVGLRPPLRGIYPLLQGFMAFESSKVAFDGIMRALISDGVNMIGLHGMPGVGKTTLVEAVRKQAGEEKLFDTVVKVIVSQTPNSEKIQNNIAEILGLKFETATKEGKAEELLRRLKGEKKILIVVDDVWEKLELLTIGIPSGSEHKGCKILLTTRDQQVCIQMNCQEKFKLKILNKDEAWALLEDKASLKDASPSLIDVAKEVADECKGLPLAIVTIGEALKNESLDGWRVANKRLKESRHLDNEDVCGGIYKCLQLSYDKLKGENIRSCLLLCSLFPEDADMHIEFLVMFGIGHGLFSELSSIEDLRREVRVSLTKLQKSGLLLETDDEETVRMHDVVRDFAHWLTSKGEGKYMVKDGLTEWPKLTESFGCYEAISLWNCDISNFPEKLKFSKLKTLILVGKNPLIVPSTFFVGMKALKVLFLIDVIFSLEALQYLTNVRTLWFVSCELKNISSAWRYMENLEILALVDTYIQELPEELEGCGLKLLYFSSSEEQHCKFPPKLLSRFASLQELHVISENNVNISEVNSLSRLTALSLRVSTDQCCQKNYVFPKLQRYNIAVNEDVDMDKVLLTVRTLKINEFSSSSLSVFENLFCNMETLSLENIVMEHKNLVPNVDHRGLNELTSLELAFCKDLEYLIDTKQKQGPTTAFSSLAALKVKEMTCFKGLCHGQPPMRFLQKLETLTINDCPKLQWVFQMDEMTNITTIKAELEENQAITLSNLRRLNLWSLPELRCIWKEPIYRVNLRSLETMIICECHKLTYLFSPSVAQSLVHLEDLEISRCDSLEHLITEAENEDEGVHAYKELLCNAKNLTLIQVMHHKNLIPNVDPEGLNELAFLELEDGKELECLIDTTHQGHVSTTAAFLNLVELVIENMIGLKMLCNGQFPKGFLQKLEKLETRNCMEMVSLSLGLQNLKEVKVINCVQLQEVFEIDDSTLHNPKEKQAVLLSTLTHLELESLPELKCIWKGLTQYISLQSLKVAKISHCNRLNYLFSPALAQSLMLLEKLKIDHCDGLEHITKELESGDEIDSDGPLSLPKLKTLKLRDCPRLKYVFQIPLLALQILVVSSCPQLKTFTNQKEVNKQGQLQELSLSNLENDKELLEKMFQDQAAGHFLSKVEKIELNDIHQWEGPIRVSSLQYLRDLKVSNCNRLKSLFSSMLARNLPQLTYLYVRSCEELEEIIEMDQTSSSSSQGLLQPVSFPSLESIDIKECNNLKRLFPVSATCSKVQRIRIGGTPKLEHVFGYEEELDVEDNQKEIIMHLLERLSLKNLPSLKSVVPMGYNLQFPYFEILRVRGCPNLTTSFSVDSEDVVHAITKAPQQVENNTADGFTTREEIVDNQPPICNDIYWDRWSRKNEIPPYINVEETEDNVTQ
ncbi:hypothetical protein REPUB_Repub05bG0032100 [Reevesia pubescens]